MPRLCKNCKDPLYACTEDWCETDKLKSIEFLSIEDFDRSDIERDESVA